MLDVCGPVFSLSLSLSLFLWRRCKNLLPGLRGRKGRLQLLEIAPSTPHTFFQHETGEEEEGEEEEAFQQFCSFLSSLLVETITILGSGATHTYM